MKSGKADDFLMNGSLFERRNDMSLPVVCTNYQLPPSPLHSTTTIISHTSDPAGADCMNSCNWAPPRPSPTIGQPSSGAIARKKRLIQERKVNTHQIKQASM